VPVFSIDSRVTHTVLIYIVCVLNGGTKNGVACYKVSSKGLKPFGEFHSLGLNQTNPATGPRGTVSHVLFSEDGSKVHASVKGLPGTSDGFIASWDVASDGTLSRSDIISIPPPGEGLIVFEMVNIKGVPSAVMAVDILLGLTVYNFSGPMTEYIPYTIPGQAASCWVRHSTTTGTYWISDEKGKIFEVATDTNTLESTLLSTFVLPTGYNNTDMAIGSINNREYV
jgi:hypothetical protein